MKFLNILILICLTLISAGQETNPLQILNPELVDQDVNWNYNMGYRFTANQDGEISKLGGRWSAGVTHTVRLYSYPSGSVLASVSVTGSGDWTYESITPISITAGNSYVVAVRLNNQSSGYYSQMTTPQSSGGITIEGSVYRSNSNNMPNNLVNTYMYGQADIVFEPCSYAGNIIVSDNSIFPGDSTSLSVSDNIGSIQWQVSYDNETFVDVLGATGTVYNTGALDTTTYYRTYIYGGSCNSDTSTSVKIEIADPFYPLQLTNVSILGENNNWNYNMGYRFVADQDGNITQLGGKWTDGITNAVRLYSYPAGTVLASTNVTGTGDWAYADITPVALTAGNTYVVAVRLNNQSSGTYGTLSMPISSGGITIEGASYQFNTNNMPTNLITTTTYGLADVRFEPCDYAGYLEAAEAIIETGDSTTVRVLDNTGNIQWQISNNNIDFLDITGETSSQINTGVLTQTTYYRTILTSNSCGGDTSASVIVKVLDPFKPLQYTGIGISSENNSWNYNMGYRFTVNKNGEVTQLGGRWRADLTYTVRLYNYPAGTVLASTNVTGTGDWSYADITPVSLTAGNTYVVAVRLDGQASAMRTDLNMPINSGEVTILNSTYVSNSNNMPTNSITNNMYGQADIKFIPCVSGGIVVAQEEEICSGNSTVLSVQGATGNLQWQSSTNGVNFTNIVGATDSVYNTTTLTQKTYYRLVASESCGSDVSNVDSVVIIGASGGRHGLWTGAFDTDWNNTCNWDDGLIPIAGDSVFILSGTNSPQNNPNLSLIYLEIDNNNGLTLSNPLTITGDLVLRSGNIRLGVNQIILESNISIPYNYSTSYIEVQGNGSVVKEYTTADGSTFVFPVGHAAGFSPISIDLNPTTTLGANASLEVDVVDAVHPSIGSPTNYISKYWTLTPTNITTPNYDVVCTYSNVDIVGLEALMITRKYTGAVGWESYNVASSLTNQLSGSGITAFGDITGSDAIQVISSGNGAWGTTSTWLGNLVPTTADNVLIQANHEIEMAGNITVLSLEIENNAKLNLNGNQLNVEGNLIVSGTTDTSGIIVFNGSTSSNLSGDIVVEDITIDNAAGVNVTSGNLGIHGVLTLEQGEFNTTAATSFTLISDAAGTARIDAANNIGTINGGVTVQRYLNGAEGYRYFSTSVLGQSISDLTDDIDIIGFTGVADPWNGAWSNFQFYDETRGDISDTGWVTPSNVTDALTKGRGFGVYVFQDGYSVLGLGPDLPATIDVTGSVDLSDHNFNISYTPHTEVPNYEQESGWNLIGNPYPSTLDWDVAAGWTKANVDDAIYIWRADIQQYSTYVNGVGTNGGSRYIPSSQGFMVKATGTSPVLIVNRNATSVQQQAFMRTALKDYQITLTLDNGADQAIIRFKEEATPYYDSKFDAYKIKSNAAGVPSLYSKAESGENLSINSLLLATNDQIEIPIYLETTDSIERTISFKGLKSLPETICYEIIDNQTATSIDLDAKEYHFMHGGSDTTHRFTLRLTNVSADFTASKDTAYAGEKVSYVVKDTYVTATDYLWDINGEKKSGKAIEYTYADTGIFEVYLLVNISGCVETVKKEVMVMSKDDRQQEDTTSIIVISDTSQEEDTVSLSMEELSRSVSTYPNPFHDELVIRIWNQKIDCISIYDLTGKKLVHLEDISEDEIHINLEKLKPGVYIEKIIQAGQVYTQEIVKY